MSDENADRELKNSIFAAKQAAESARSGIPQQQHLPAHIAYQQQAAMTEQEVREVPLPSMGVVYPEDHPLFNKSVVEIFEMRTKEEDILMNSALVKKGTVITELIRSCLVNKKINPGDLISGDRNALMIGVRITGYTEEYKVKLTCPRCDRKHHKVVDLTTFPIKELDRNKVKQVGPNEFLLSLPSGRTITYKFLTGADEERIVQELEVKRKQGIAQDNLVTTRLMASILSVDGNHARDVVARFCQNMPARDSFFLRKHIDECEPSVQMVAELTCENTECEFSGKVNVPLTAGFFYPHLNTND